MLTEQRYEKILGLLEQKDSVTVMELKKLLGISDSTVRRDLAALDKAGKLVKVFGGAVRMGSDAAQKSSSAEQEHGCCWDEKRRIGKYAAGLLEPGDVIYMDAGTTVGCMIDFLTVREITVVTNDIEHAKRLTDLGYRTVLTGGELKGGIVAGTDAVECVKRYAFTKGFFGTAGISCEAGFTARDSVEAAVKKAAFSRCPARYVMGDHTKLEHTGEASFGALEEGILLTDEDTGEEIDDYTKVWRIN